MESKIKSNRWEIILVLVFIFLYSTAASLVSLHRHWQYNSFWYDLGIFDTTIWKLSRFQLPIIETLNPPAGKIVWADHFNPSVILLSPLYWLTDKTEIILTIQVVAVGLSALVAYIIALEKLKNGLVRVSLIFSYLGFVGLQNALYTDVHNIVFALLPLMLVFWAMQAKKWGLYLIFLLMTLGIQENLAIVVMMLGIFLIIRNKENRTWGFVTILIGILYAILTIKILIPFLNNGRYAYQPNIPKIWYEWLTGLFVPINMKLKTILVTYATFGFMPLLSLATLPLILEHYWERFVLNSAGTRWDLGFHYNALISPIMFLAAVEAINKLQRRKFSNKLLSIWAVITIFLVLYLHRFYIHGPLMLATHPAFYGQTEKMKFLDKFVRQIPRTGLLMTQNNLAPHFTHGKTVLLNKNYQFIKPEVIAVDLRPGQNPNNFFPLTEEDAKMLVAELLSDQNYQTKKIADSQFIFIRKK